MEAGAKSSQFETSLGPRAELHTSIYNRLSSPDALLEETKSLAHEIANGPTFAHGMTKRMLVREWNMGVIEAIEAEAEAQSICMQTRDFRRAYNAFVKKETPKFEGD